MYRKAFLLIRLPRLWPLARWRAGSLVSDQKASAGTWTKKLTLGKRHVLPQ